jgi:hypothetical protein
MYTEEYWNQWWTHQDEEGWTADQEVADKTIFRDQCQSAIEKYGYAWLIEGWWLKVDGYVGRTWVFGCLHGAARFSKHQDLMDELDFLASLFSVRFPLEDYI